MLLLLSSLSAVRRRRWRVIWLLLALTVAGWLGASWLAVHVLTRRARPAFAEPAPHVAWGTLESVQLQTSDGERLGAWFAAGTEDGPSILLLHGNGETRRKMLPLAQHFAGRGCSVLAVTLRAHGDSTGAVNDFGFSARRDVLAAVAYLERRRPGRPIIVEGTSMGAAAAIFAASELGTRVRGYLLEAAYADLRTAVRNRTENHLPFPLSCVAYAGLALTGPLVLPDLPRMAPVEYIGAIPASVPVVLLAGGRDRDARPGEAQALFERVRTHATLVWFAQAQHESFYTHDPARYRSTAAALLTAAAPPAALARAGLPRNP